MLLFSSPLFSLLVFFETLLSSSSWIVLRAFFRSLLLVHEFSFVYRRVGGRRILELGAAFQSSSLFGQPVVRGATFLHQHLSVRIILIESLVAAVIPQVLQRPSQCVSIGCLSLVAPTAILIKLVFLLSFSVCWVRVWVCGSLFSFSLCSCLLLYRLNLRGKLGPISYNWRPITGLNPRPDFFDHVAVFRSSPPSFQFFFVELASVVSFLYSTEYSQQRELLR